MTAANAVEKQRGRRAVGRASCPLRAKKSTLTGLPQGATIRAREGRTGGAFWHEPFYALESAVMGGNASLWWHVLAPRASRVAAGGETAYP